LNSSDLLSSLSPDDVVVVTVQAQQTQDVQKELKNLKRKYELAREVELSLNFENTVSLRTSRHRNESNLKGVTKPQANRNQKCLQQQLLQQQQQLLQQQQQLQQQQLQQQQQQQQQQQ